MQTTERAQLAFHQKYRFWLLLVAAFIIHQIPLMSVPFKWLESYFHEISHGIAALVTGGSIVQIQLFPNGAGLCTTRGGWAFVISFMGYAGASIWGTLIYLLSSMHQRYAKVFSVGLVAIILTSIIFYVRDLLTLVITIILLLIFALPFKFQKTAMLPTLLQVSGLLVLLNSLYSPTYLFAYQQQGDSAALSSLTMVPEIVWVGCWLIIALFCLFQLAKRGK